MSKYTFPLSVAGLADVAQLSRTVDQNLRDLEVWLSLQPTVLERVWVEGAPPLGALPVTLYRPYPTLIRACHLAFTTTPPAGADYIVDVHVGGVTVFTTQANRPTVPDGEYVSAWHRPDITVWPADTPLTLEVDQVGTVDPGTGLTVTLDLAGSVL